MMLCDNRMLITCFENGAESTFSPLYPGGSACTAEASSKTKESGHIELLTRISD